MLKIKFNLVLMTFVIGLLSQTIFSIVIRHDRADEKYLALGTKCPAYGYFQERVGCTLIAPQWAITAAHPARISGTTDISADTALLKLKQPVTDIAPALLYERTDEAGKNIVILGSGQTGNGLTGATQNDGKLRGATK